MARKRRRRKSRPRSNIGLFMSIFIVTIMVLSVLGMMMGNNHGPGTEEYNGFVFNYNGYNYITEYEGKALVMDTAPWMIEHISFPKQAVSDLRGSVAWTLLFDPEDEAIVQIEQARFDLENMKPIIKKQIGSAITHNSSIYDLEVLDCNAATKEFPIIEMVSGNNNSFTYHDGCLRLEYEDPAALDMMVERLVYSYIGIIYDGS